MSYDFFVKEVTSLPSHVAKLIAQEKLDVKIFQKLCLRRIFKLFRRIDD